MKTNLPFGRAVILILAVVCVWPGRARADENFASIEDIEKALTFKSTDPLAIALGAVEDEVSQWQETAFYMLLDRAGSLGKLREKDFHKLDQVAYRNLLREPTRYRCRPMRMRVCVFRVLEMTPKTGLGRSRIWPRDRSVWRIYGAHADAEKYYQEPITIYSTVEPTRLGTVTGVARDGEKRYKHGPVIEVACVFYKLYKAREKESGATRLYPLLLAWQMKPAGGGGGIGGGFDPKMIVAACLIGVMGLIFYFVRRHVKRLRKAAGPIVEYKSHRDAVDDDEADGDEKTFDADDDGCVDPLLKAAADQYEKERQSEDGTNCQG